MPKELPEYFLTATQLSRMLSVPMNVLKRWRHQGLPPPYYIFERQCIRYRLYDVYKFLEECRVVPDAMQIFEDQKILKGADSNEYVRTVNRAVLPE